MKEITTLELNDLKNKEKSILVIFSSPTCSPCKNLHATIQNNVEPKCNAVKYVEIDVTKKENEDFVNTCGVKSVPTIMLYLNGEKETFRGKDLNGNIVEDDKLTKIPPRFDAFLIKLLNSIK